MTSLRSFLLARIDEDRAIAEAAAATWHPEWEYDPARTPYGWSSNRKGHEPDVPMIVTADEHGSQMLMSLWDAQFDGPILEHVAHFDPARAMLDVKAKIAVFQVHDWEPETFRKTSCAYLCTICCTSSCFAVEGLERHLDGPPCCTTLRALALSYSAHPDFDPAWLISEDS